MLLRNLFLAGTCLMVIDTASIDNLTVVKTFARYIPRTILAKAISGLAIVSGHHISTGKTIWEGKIGKHPMTVIHNNEELKADRDFQQLLGFNFNSVNYQTAVELWKKNRPIFEKILPHINDAYPIEIRMCASGWQASEFRWPQEAYHLLKPWARELSEYTIWVGSSIRSITQEESAFILAHEVGHILLKHTQRAPKTDKESRTFEKQADIRAIKILNSADGGIQYFNRLAYPKNPLDRLEMALRDRFYGATTHPFHHERIKYLQHWKSIHERGKSTHRSVQ